MDGEDDWDQAVTEGGGAAVAVGEDDWDTGGAAQESEGGGFPDQAQAQAGGAEGRGGGGADDEAHGEEGEADDDNEGTTDDRASSRVLLMKFCPHDSSMLYPQEQKAARTLRYACRLCRYSEEARGALIYRNAIKKELGNVLSTVPAAVSDDPTLPRSQNASCMNCGHHEAVFFQSDTSDIRSDSLALIFVCCNCRHKWVA